MKLPIYVHGSDVLRQPSHSVPQEYPALATLIKNMYDTMDGADGIGLAAPQVGKNIRLFILDLSLFEDGDDMTNDHPELTNQTFINPKIVSVSEERCDYLEGCLSIPGINEMVERPKEITIEYVDENWVKHTKTYSGMWSRAIQHEYEHLEGNLFIDSISPIRKQMLSSKLNAMTRGKYTAHYKTR